MTRISICFCFYENMRTIYMCFTKITEKYVDISSDPVSNADAHDTRAFMYSRENQKWLRVPRVAHAHHFGARFRTHKHIFGSRCPQLQEQFFF